MGEMLTFLAGDRRLAVDFSRVLEIGDCTRITRVPGSPRGLRGLVRRAGEAVPVIDSAVALGGELIRPSVRSRIVFLQTSTRCIGLLVEAVSQVAGDDQVLLDVDRLLGEMLDQDEEMT